MASSECGEIWASLFSVAIYGLGRLILLLGSYVITLRTFYSLRSFAGNEFMKSNEVDHALQAYTEAINLDPTNPILYCNR